MGKKTWVSYFFMKNPYMKFQNPSMYGLEVMLCIKTRNGRTHGRTHAHTNVPEAICPSNFFEVGGIINTAVLLYKGTKVSKYFCKKECCGTQLLVPWQGAFKKYQQYMCSSDRYTIHLNCLAVQAGFYSDVVECWLATQVAWVQSPAMALVIRIFRAQSQMTHRDSKHICVQSWRLK